MAMFGASRLRNPYDTPGYGLGQEEYPPQSMPENPIALPTNPFARALPQPEAPQGQQPMGAMPPQTSGMFGAPQSNYGPVKGTLSEKLMALGGIFGNLGGQRNDAVQQYFQTLEGRREEQRKAHLAEAARYAPQEVGGNIVQLNQQTGQYETRYNGQKAPETPQIVRLQQIYDDPATTPSVRATVKAAIEAQTNPVITYPGGGMGLRSMVTGALGGGSSEPPSAAVDMLRKDPTLLPQFEAKYGPGSAQKYLGAGGPTVAPSATFR